MHPSTPFFKSFESFSCSQMCLSVIKNTKPDFSIKAGHYFLCWLLADICITLYVVQHVTSSYQNIHTYQLYLLNWLSTQLSNQSITRQLLGAFRCADLLKFKPCMRIRKKCNLGWSEYFRNCWCTDLFQRKFWKRENLQWVACSCQRSEKKG